MPTEDEMRANADQLVSTALSVADSYRSLITQNEKLAEQLLSARAELVLAEGERGRMLTQVAQAEHDRDNAKMAAALLQEQLFDVEEKLTFAEHQLSDLETAVAEMKQAEQ